MTDRDTQALSDERVAAEMEELIETLRSFSRAYPEDIFPPPDPAVLNTIHAEYPGATDRISAAMGRHCAKYMAKAADALERGLLSHTAPQAEPSKVTDLSHRLRETADQQPGWKPLLTAAADEIERYYGGMLAWKQTAEAKDAEFAAASPVSAPAVSELPPLPPFDYYVTLENGDDYGCWSRETMREVQRQAYAQAAIALTRPEPAAPAQPDVATLVDRFLAWPLPESVCSDPCSSMQGYPHRSGTSLLTADEAKAMFLHCLGTAARSDELEALQTKFGMMKTAYDTELSILRAKLSTARAATWAEAIEAAAKVCDAEHRRDDLTGDYRYGAGICALNIRALQCPEQPAEAPPGSYPGCDVCTCPPGLCQSRAPVMSAAQSDSKDAETLRKTLVAITPGKMKEPHPFDSSMDDEHERIENRAVVRGWNACRDEVLTKANAMYNAALAQQAGKEQSNG